MDVYINNFLITHQNRQSPTKIDYQEKDSNSNESSSLVNTESNQQSKQIIIDDQIKSDNLLLIEDEFSKKSPTILKVQQGSATSSFAMRKRTQNQSEEIIQSANFNRNFDSSRGQADSRNDQANLTGYNTTFLSNKGFNSGNLDKELMSKDETSIQGEEFNDSQDEGDDLSYFQLNYISQTGAEQIKKVRRVRRTYLDQLPEANPIAKRELQGIEPVRSVYDHPLKIKDQSLTNQYLEQFHMATEKPEEFQKLLGRKEPLGVRNINAINANYFAGNSNPGISVNASEGGSQIRSFIYQVFTEDNNIVYLRTPLLSNSVLCTLYKMTALRNGEPYSDFKSKEAAELNQQERLEQTIKDNLSKIPKVLHFESKFESGNLSIAAMKNTDEYNLLLQNDVNTKGYTQWFFFSVKKTHRNQTVKFNILNFYKNGSLFNEGMKISIFSKKKYDLTQTGWFKGAFEIGYIKNNIVKQNDNYYYTLTFKYTFDYTDDEVFFAYNIPYTYSQLNQFLHKCEIDPYKNQFIYKKILCRTLIGNKLDLITITNPCKNTQDEMSQRKGVIISARVHPGETVSSYIMEGIIEYLLQNTKESHFLREKFIFKIIPMLNPDGVIHGNYRCSLAGCDLNRRWKNPNQTLHPEIYYTKQMIFDFKQKNDIAMVIDLHGHSRKMNVFAYGCHDKKKPFECREFPFILSKLNQSFSFKDCNFKVQKNREGTARIALYKSLGIANIFTIESSFCGPSYINSHFTQEHLKEMGHSICQSVLMKFEMQNYQQFMKSQEQTDSTNQANQKSSGLLQTQQEGQQSSFFQKICSQPNLCQNKVFLDELYDNPDNIDIGVKNDSGSDSEPSGDNMSDEELKKIFTSKTKKSKKQLDKNTKDIATIQPPQSTKDPMSQTQNAFKRKTQSNFITKSPEKKLNIPSQGISSTEVKQRAFNFDKAPSPVRSRTVIKNSFHQTGYNFIKDQRNQKPEKESSNPTKNMTVLEPKFVYFPLKVPDAFPNIDKFKSSLRETKLRKLRENSQIRQQMGNPQQTHRVMQMKLRQSYNNGTENTVKVDKKQMISPREFKFNQAIPQPIDSSQIEYQNPAYSGIRDTVNTNKSQLGRILRTIMNTQTPDWIYGYQGGNSQYETLNKSFVQEGSQTLSRGQSKQLKQFNYQPPSTANPVEKSQRSKSNDISQYVFKMQKYDIFNGNFTSNQEQNDVNKNSNKSLLDNQFYQPTFSDYKTLQKTRFDQAVIGVPTSNSAQTSLNNSFASINNNFIKQQKIIKPQSAPRTVRKSINAHSSIMNNPNIFSNQDTSRIQSYDQELMYGNGSNTVALDDKPPINQQSTFQPIKIVYI